VPAARKSLVPFYEALAEHRRRLARVADRRALPRLKRLYDEAHDALARALRTRLRAGLGDTFTTHQQRIVLAQLRLGQRGLAAGMAGELADVTSEASVDSVRALARGIARLEKHFTGAEVTVPIDSAWKLRELVTKRRASLDTMHRRSMARWGARLFTKVHEQTSLALAMEKTTAQAIEMIPEAAAAEWWQGERIVRTETSWAINSTNADGIKEAADVLPDIKKRWSEHVDDDTLQPLDDRVAPDSLAMHGQVVDADGEFRFPDADPGEVGEKEAARLSAAGPWFAPPNRPNDRATIQPWRREWGISAWIWDGGRKVWL